MRVSHLFLPHSQVRITRTFITNQPTKERKQARKKENRKSSMEKNTSWEADTSLNRPTNKKGDILSSWQLSSSCLSMRDIFFIAIAAQYHIITIYFDIVHSLRHIIIIIIISSSSSSSSSSSKNQQFADKKCIYIYIYKSYNLYSYTFRRSTAISRIIPTIYLIENVMRPVYIYIQVK